MTHPLDPVESALVDASNALNDCDADFDTYPVIEDAIDKALRLVQAEIEADERELERDAIEDDVFDRSEVK